MCFFSPSGVQAVNAELSKGKRNSINTLHEDDGPPTHLPLIAAIGPTTAQSVEQIFGKPPDATALNPTATSLLEAIEAASSQWGNSNKEQTTLS